QPRRGRAPGPLRVRPGPLRHRRRRSAHRRRARAADRGREPPPQEATPMNAVDRGKHEQEIARELERRRARLTGPVVEPGDPHYAEARRVWNGMVDARPRAVVQAGDVSDIDPVLAAAQHTELPLAVRGGGHNVAGHGTVEGGLVLDLGALRQVEVDPGTRRVTVEPGATLADVDRATVPHGLAVPLGVVSATGVAGLTVGGGVGWLTRSNGLSLDNLVDAEVITGTR